MPEPDRVACCCASCGDMAVCGADCLAEASVSVCVPASKPGIRVPIYIPASKARSTESTKVLARTPCPACGAAAAEEPLPEAGTGEATVFSLSDAAAGADAEDIAGEAADMAEDPAAVVFFVFLRAIAPSLSDDFDYYNQSRILTLCKPKEQEARGGRRRISAAAPCRIQGLQCYFFGAVGVSGAGDAPFGSGAFSSSRRMLAFRASEAFSSCSPVVRCATPLAGSFK